MTQGTKSAIGENKEDFRKYSSISNITQELLER